MNHRELARQYGVALAREKVALLPEYDPERPYGSRVLQHMGGGAMIGGGLGGLGGIIAAIAKKDPRLLGLAPLGALVGASQGLGTGLLHGAYSSGEETARRGEPSAYGKALLSGMGNPLSALVHAMGRRSGAVDHTSG